MQVAYLTEPTKALHCYVKIWGTGSRNISYRVVLEWQYRKNRIPLSHEWVYLRISSKSWLSSDVNSIEGCNFIVWICWESLGSRILLLCLHIFLFFSIIHEWPPEVNWLYCSRTIINISCTNNSLIFNVNKFSRSLLPYLRHSSNWEFYLLSKSENCACRSELCYLLFCRFLVDFWKICEADHQ